MATCPACRGPMLTERPHIHRRPAPRQDLHPKNCAVLERIGDGVAVFCWHYLEEGHCPRHGDVHDLDAAQAREDAKGRP